MLSGLNVDVEYQGQVFHVQTEAGSKTRPTVVTTVFKGGAILASRKTSYAHLLLDSPELKIILRNLGEFMNKQHKDMILEVQEGRVAKASPRPVAAPAPAAPSVAPAPEPAAQKPAGPKSLDDLILDYLEAKQEGKQ